MNNVSYQEPTSEFKLIPAYKEEPRSINFSLVYEKYSPKVYGKCLSLLKDEALAKDAMQEVFLRVHLKYAQFRQEASISTWIYSITYNYCMDCLKKQQTRKIKLSDDMDEALNIAEEDVDHYSFDAKVEVLQAVLKELPRTDRTILLMKFQEEMSIKEMAIKRNKSEGAIKMKLNRAKDKARQLRLKHVDRLTA